MPDEQPIVFAPLQLNIEGVISWLYNHLMGAGSFESLSATVTAWWYVFAICSFIVSVLLMIGFVYALIRYSELREQEDAALKDAERVFRHAHATRDENTKWQQIVVHASSDNPSDWRLAVIEADIMLDALLDSLGYVGTSIGDKLKTVQPGAFRSIEDAWDAHKVRNAIAHEGSDFVLTKRATQDAIAQYQRVFEEFQFL